MSEPRAQILPSRIILTGPSGSGKSTVAAEVARRCGYGVVDTDSVIEQRIGMPIATFFERFGETAFRSIEREELAEACKLNQVVIATGGGVVLDPFNWTLMRPGSAIIGLTAEPVMLVERVRTQEAIDGEQAVRPLLSGDAMARVEVMLENRQKLYNKADRVIVTDLLSFDEVVEAVLAASSEVAANGQSPALSIDSPLERSDIYIGAGTVNIAADVTRQRWPSAKKIWMITDSNVAPIWGHTVQRIFGENGYQVQQIVVPAGESSKSFEQLAAICEEITTRGATRRDVIVALGGGVVGDLAGLAAAIILRGLSIVQIPTSLLAMVDSSVGGKTGINTPGGKNLVGALYQPGVVLVDPQFLTTLPDAEYRSGMAEVIKHGYIQSSTPLGGNSLRESLYGLDQLAPVPEDRISAVLATNIAIKHSVVQADERESGLRMLLNFGHTAGHAIEADGFQYRHGEAVALGMLTVAMMAERQGRAPVGFAPDMQEILGVAGLPTRLTGSADSIVERLSRDKKNVDGQLHWVMPKADGGVEIVTGIPTDDVRQALRSIGAT